MRERDFEHWLEHTYKTREGRPMERRSRGSRLSNCLHVEEYEGSLDDQWRKDRMQSLLRKFEYTRAEEARHVKPRHRIPIDGCLYDGTATLASAVRLYAKFCEAWAPGALAPAAITAAPLGARARTGLAPREPGKGAWSVWEQPSDAHLLEMARGLAPMVRFLAPEIVRAVVEDNERHHAEWAAALAAHGVDADRYLWPRGSCAFPGVRRHAGGAEIARHRGKQKEAGERPAQAVAIDDNNYPKHLWSFVLRGRPFQQFGPAGYELGHLLDHKDYKTRLPHELVGGESFGARVPYGLYTCASNAVYLPKALLRPTDHEGLLRGLLQRRAQDLYGGSCALAPPPAQVKSAPSADWETKSFTWATPVGEPARMAQFLAFRRERMGALLTAGGRQA